MIAGQYVSIYLILMKVFFSLICSVANFTDGSR